MRVYILTGPSSLSLAEAASMLAAELGVEAKIVVVQSLGKGILVNGLLVRSEDELPLRLAEAIIGELDPSSLVLACCS